MPKVAPPPDLLAFLRSGASLSYDASRCECGRVTLVSAEQLTTVIIPVRTEDTPHHKSDPNRHTKGHYACAAVNLVASCEAYDPEGILCWLPDLQQYGAWDNDHRILKSFPGVSWTVIAADPLPYLNAQWQRSPGEFVQPWLHYRFVND